MRSFVFFNLAFSAAYLPALLLFFDPLNLISLDWVIGLLAWLLGAAFIIFHKNEKISPKARLLITALSLLSNLAIIQSFDKVQPNTVDLHQLKTCEKSFFSINNNPTSIPYYCRHLVAQEISAEPCKNAELGKTFDLVKRFVDEIPNNTKESDVRELLNRHFGNNFKFLDIKHRALIQSSCESNLGFDLWFWYGRNSTLDKIELVQIIYPPLSPTASNSKLMGNSFFDLRNFKQERWVLGGRSCTITFDGNKFSNVFSSEKDVVVGSFESDFYGTVKIAMSKSFVKQHYGRRNVTLGLPQPTELELLCEGQ